MPGLDDAHLKQQQLNHEGIQDMLHELGEWLTTALFSANNEGVQVCADQGLPQASHPLLTALRSQNKINPRNIKFNVLRIRGAKYPIKPRDAADLMPVSLRGGNAAASRTSLAVGTLIHITRGVVIEVDQNATLDLLFVVESPSAA